MNDFLRYLSWLCQIRGTPESLRFASMLANPPATPATDDEIAAAALVNPKAYPSNVLAIKIRTRTFFTLRSLDCVLRAIDELDYLPILVDALMRYHRKALLLAPSGSDAMVVRLDIEWAISKLTEKERFLLHRLTEIPQKRIRRKTIMWRGKKQQLTSVKRELVSKVSSFLRHPVRRSVLTEKR